MASGSAGGARLHDLARKSLSGEATPAGPTTPESTTNVTDRLMIYDGTMTLVVQDTAATLAKLKAMAAALKGYMQGMTSSSIVLRIPAAQFNQAIQAVENLGEVIDQSITGSDVTEEMRDLDIRLKNEEQIRERLVKLLDKGAKVEDILKVEKEHTYLLAVIANKKYVYTFECWGPSESVTRDREALDKTLKSLRLKP
ncbi:MAG: DUF4349 domain-containing protein [Lentisphaerae bacterium]|nr:DUF4349 domain-containing protein [Lentisphaerota bacterium]